MPFLSIIIPVYNAEKYLNDLFADIKRQNFADYEVLIVDDGSKDHSPQICDRYALDDSRVKVFHVPNGGLSSARNIGLRHASGVYLYYVDDDDLISGDSLFRSIFDSLSKNPVDVLQMGAKYFKEGETSPRKVLELPEIQEGDIACPAKTIYGLMKAGKYETSCWTKVISRDFLLANELFFDVSLGVEDLDWNMRFFSKIKRYNLLPSTDYLHYFRHGSISSATGEKSYKNCMDQIVTICRWEKIYRNLGGNELLKKAALSYLCYQYFITMGRCQTLEKKYRRKVADELKKMRHLFQYAIGRKQKIIRIFYQVMGFHGCLWLLGKYFKQGRSGAGKLNILHPVRKEFK